MSYYEFLKSCFNREKFLSFNEFTEKIKYLHDFFEDLNDNKKYQILKKHYNIYKSNFPYNKRISRHDIHLIGFKKIRKNKKEYYIYKGYSENEAKNILKTKYGTNDINYIMKKYKCSVKKAHNILRDRKKQEYNTKLNNPNWKNIKKSYGRSIDSYLNKINPETNEYYTYTEAKKKVHDIQSEMSKRRWNKVRSGVLENIPNTTLEYYINKGMDITEAKKALSRRQDTRSLKRHIERYGEKEGIKKYNQKIQKYKKTCSLKSSDELLDWKIKKVNRSKFYSDSSIKIFNSILENIHIPYNIFMKDNEYFIYDEELKKIYFYDFCVPSINMIIEYHGIKFHPNKDKLNENEWDSWKQLFSNKKAEEVYQKDKRKKEIAIKNDFDYFVIWEDDPMESKINELKYEIISRIK